ncbi:hypothetical protein VOLCADRAFT_88878 [Volvox carteri f. nagariensis]|uniref:Uncharacterized protein n=1 Tax=Volvox carteri f. nagariensis TaxID=3068 RepID=D8TQ70_VOLCA|nr:uncharacterized protein VOLCADRAFT_88878 [Volvox carteri f. nagariensis]EFJ50483.1 hypothetical protein VOLCADRAFT_88878 [Volvox carteri f. nagariensis]|eukprot:XP_002948608.1 hypothetical protein VOLCADRAFT_88878 [Volvox carteri f. nagariensis]
MYVLCFFVCCVCMCALMVLTSYDHYDQVMVWWVDTRTDSEAIIVGCSTASSPRESLQNNTTASHYLIHNCIQTQYICKCYANNFCPSAAAMEAIKEQLWQLNGEVTDENVKLGEVVKELRKNPEDKILISDREFSRIVQIRAELNARRKNLEEKMQGDILMYHEP